MCGIAGAFGIQGWLDPAVRQSLPDMTRALAHRGPDGEGLFADERVALGHRRLSIIDRTHGQQPMTNEDRSCWVVFNGEIYNHTELRRQLAGRGHVFQSASDTEVIVHAYEEYGPSCVDLFEGMFAFAVYDRKRQELFVARDRIGKKPLYYAAISGVFHFASEIKALRRSPVWDDELDLSALEGYLSLGYFLAPSTIYRHVRMLEPGHWLHISRGQVENRQYWDVTQFDRDQRTPDIISGELTELLRARVSERLESEVPLGAFLSGGIDSGLVVSFMAETMKDPVLTTTVGFAESRHNELDAAAMTAQRFRTRHHAEVVTPELDEVMDPIVSAFDQPFADSSAIPTYYVSAFARRHVTVALSGDGGDEVFGGYSFRYTQHALEDYARGLVSGHLGRRVTSWLGESWPRSPRLPRPLRLATILENLGHDAASAYYNDLCFLKPRQARRLLGLPWTGRPDDSPVYEAVTEPYRRCPSASAVQRAQYADLKVYLPNDVLVKVDRMSMAHGLEVRCPLLDRRLVEFGFRVPTSAKLPWLKAKYLLRRMAADRLPQHVLKQPKRGFTAPIGNWIAEHYRDRFVDEVTGSNSFVSTFLDVDRVRHALAEHREGAADQSYVLWAVWMFERWARLRRAESREVAKDARELSRELRRPVAVAKVG